MTRILVADDRADDRRMMHIILGGMGHEVVEAANGEEALDLARATHPDLVLSDVLMPRMDGFALCRQMKADPALRRLPFVLVTAAYAEPRYREFARDVGAVRVLLKPFEPSELRALVDQLLAGEPDPDATRRLAQLGDARFHERHAQVVGSKLEQQVVALEQANSLLRDSEAHARDLLTAMVATIDKMVEYRDPYTTGHQRRVGELAACIAGELGLPGSRVEGVRIGGYLHDVGKIASPAELLTRPRRLNAVEYALIQGHAEAGYSILSAIRFPWPVAAIARQHHERQDGSGYPQGLKGEQILLESRIVAVADVVEAMSSHRPFRGALGIDAALQELERGRGSAYDAAVVDACLALFREGRFAFD